MSEETRKRAIEMCTDGSDRSFGGITDALTCHVLDEARQEWRRDILAHASTTLDATHTMAMREASSPAGQAEEKDWITDACARWEEDSDDRRTVTELARDVARHVRKEERAKLTSRFGDTEQMQVQLAGCSVAASGGTKEPATRGQYGWSPAYQDVLDLRLKYEAALEAVSAERAKVDEQAKQYAGRIAEMMRERDEAVRKARVKLADYVTECVVDVFSVHRNREEQEVVEYVRSLLATETYDDRLERDQPAASECACDFRTDSPKIDPSCSTHGKSRPGQGMAEPSKPSPTTEAPETITQEWVLAQLSNYRGISDDLSKRIVKMISDVVDRRVAEAVADATNGTGYSRAFSELGGQAHESLADAARRVVADRDTALARVRELEKQGKDAVECYTACVDGFVAGIHDMGNHWRAAQERAEAAERERDEVRRLLQNCEAAIERAGKALRGEP